MKRALVSICYNLSSFLKRITARYLSRLQPKASFFLLLKFSLSTKFSSVSRYNWQNLAASRPEAKKKVFLNREDNVLYAVFRNLEPKFSMLSSSVTGHSSTAIDIVKNMDFNCFNV